MMIVGIAAVLEANAESEVMMGHEDTKEKMGSADRKDLQDLKELRELPELLEILALRDHQELQ
jgi:hypothetical protein